jgi:hypothetical protein
VNIGDLAIGFVAGAYFTVGCFQVSQRLYFRSLRDMTLSDIFGVVLIVAFWPAFCLSDHE